MMYGMGAQLNSVGQPLQVGEHTPPEAISPFPPDSAFRLCLDENTLVSLMAALMYPSIGSMADTAARARLLYHEVHAPR